ncbi:MAG TPA: S1/P1 nuclease [Pyrinomonadaceae bacterium]|nr:S1/P1 nuclease [Pyrinomonadaceae bacterium]
MKKILLTALLLVVTTLFPTLSAFAWDDVGHKITAYIAWQQMTPDVRERVIKILLAAPEDAQLSTFYLSYGSRTDEARKREFFMIASTWPDIIRDRNFDTRYKKYHHSNWHYSDTLWTEKNGKVELVTSIPGEGLAMEKIAEFIKLEQQSDASDADKAIGIAWLEHLIGDIHQPLHASGRVTDLEPKGDQGANLFLLTPKDTPREKQDNLHWFWDNIVVRNIPNTSDSSDDEYLFPIAKDIMKKYPFDKMQSRLSLDDPEQWKKESFETASTKLYPPDLKRFEAPSQSYKTMAMKIAEERLALAGYRMGALFNKLFATPAAATVK